MCWGCVNALAFQYFPFFLRASLWIGFGLSLGSGELSHQMIRLRGFWASGPGQLVFGLSRASDLRLKVYR